MAASAVQGKPVGPHNRSEARAATATGAALGARAVPGAAGQGGGLFVAGGIQTTVLDSAISENACVGGTGGIGGTGGRGGRGGSGGPGQSATVFRDAGAGGRGGTGGGGGTGGAGGQGGAAQGGEMFVSVGTLSVSASTLADNSLALARAEKVLPAVPAAPAARAATVAMGIPFTTRGPLVHRATRAMLAATGRTAWLALPVAAASHSSPEQPSSCS